ncbi:MAG: S9 family peptidase, partial [Bacteroidetes bacterium]|nr:S9 family peptidase [Bacteroidota bacterium]
TGDDKDIEPGIYHFDLKTGERTSLITGKGEYKQLSMNKEGSLLAFLANQSDEKDKKKDYSLYLWQGDGEATQIVSNDTEGIPDYWEVSVNGRLSFSESENRVFLGIAPIPPEKDTTILEEELPVVDIWHWNEPVLHTQQILSRSRDLKRNYLAVYHLDSNKLVHLQKENLRGFSLIDKGDAQKAVAWSNIPYAVQGMWEGSPSHNDIYLVDTYTGATKMIKKDLRATPQASTSGKYLYWYEALDTTWHTYKLETGKEFVIASAKTIQSADELNDRPQYASSYRTAGWLKDDKALLIYDRYDIWQVDPENKAEPVNLTRNGRKNKTSYRLMRLDQAGFGGQEDGLDVKKLQYLKGHNEITREDGFYTLSLKKANEPKALIYGPYKLGAIQKARESDDLVFTKEDFQVFPDLLASDLKFKDEIRISNANPQQEEFLWGTAELVTWTSLDGIKLEGTLHKPANFDKNKKYPMIVNFYEKSSQGLFSHRTPEIGRSTIGYHYYTSHGYLVFNPDVYYKEGYPGEDAFNCVMPGVTAFVNQGFVDDKHIGAQGHSWGGYQVAYLATRTNMFAAIESGAPVVNMFSAYGGIRWGSGQNRSFQYEQTQSRIGKSIWESPLRYIENSPIFTMDKVQTPILIMHNDDDGAVPWYQGIEYFIALRRMGKPAWLLNYNNAAHWPTRLEDKHDFQIRMAQFFDHYLKGEPMPKWMKEGVPAVKKGLEWGY